MTLNNIGVTGQTGSGYQATSGSGAAGTQNTGSQESEDSALFIFDADSGADSQSSSAGDGGILTTNSGQTGWQKIQNLYKRFFPNGTAGSSSTDSSGVITSGSSYNVEDYGLLRSESGFYSLSGLTTSGGVNIEDYGFSRSESGSYSWSASDSIFDVDTDDFSGSMAYSAYSSQSYSYLGYGSYNNYLGYGGLNNSLAFGAYNNYLGYGGLNNSLGYGGLNNSLAFGAYNNYLGYGGYNSYGLQSYNYLSYLDFSIYDPQNYLTEEVSAVDTAQVESDDTTTSSSDSFYYNVDADDSDNTSSSTTTATTTSGVQALSVNRTLSASSISGSGNIDSLSDLEEQGFVMEGSDPSTGSGVFTFDAREEKVKTPNSGGDRHEIKLDKSERTATESTHETFSATITPELSDGSKAIVAQLHPSYNGATAALYIADTAEGGKVDGTAKDGVFEVYLKVKDEDGNTETFKYGTIESGDSIDVQYEQKNGKLQMTVMGVESDVYDIQTSDADYFKFGVYLQAKDPVTNERAERGEEEAFYQEHGIDEARATFTNVSYSRTES